MKNLFVTGGLGQDGKILIRLFLIIEHPYEIIKSGLTLTISYTSFLFKLISFFFRNFRFFGSLLF